MPTFTKDGRLMIPIAKHKKNTNKETEKSVRYVIDHAYCPKGCSIIDNQNIINGYPGLRFKFERESCKGEFVISAIEGDFDKVIISGELKQGAKDELYCPHCGVAFEKLVNCKCSPGAEMVVVGLTSRLDYNNAITFCNVTGCSNGTFIKSGDVISRIRLYPNV